MQTALKVYPKMSLRHLLVLSLSIVVLPATAFSGSLSQSPSLSQMASSSSSSLVKSAAAAQAPCAVSGLGKAALGSAVGLGATAAAKKAGVKNAQVVGLVISSLLTDKIACLLNPEEQTQAATATHSVVQQAVGAKVDWTSTTRPDVTGVSSVTAETKKPDGALCRVVRDVIIVGGEETVASKTLCRAVGASGFTLAAAG